MATKRGSSKKASKKSAAKKSSKKASKKAEAVAAAFPINLRCIITCVERYNRCLQKGVDRATCQKRLMRCIQRCTATGGADPGPDE